MARTNNDTMKYILRTSFGMRCGKPDYSYYAPWKANNVHLTNVKRGANRYGSKSEAKKARLRANQRYPELEFYIIEYLI